jgi:hypothetical protein
VKLTSFLHSPHEQRQTRVMDWLTSTTSAPPSWQWKLLIVVLSAVYTGIGEYNMDTALVAVHGSTSRWTIHRTIPARVLWTGTTTSYRFDDKEDSALVVGASQYIPHLRLGCLGANTGRMYVSQPPLNTWALNYPPTVTKTELSPEKKSMHRSMTRICLGYCKASTGRSYVPHLSTNTGVSNYCVFGVSRNKNCLQFTCLLLKLKRLEEMAKRRTLINDERLSPKIEWDMTS